MDDTAEQGAPVGRRVVLGMLAASVAGVLFGARVQDTFERVLTPVALRDPTGVLGLLPTGARFRIYSVVGFLPSRDRARYRLGVGGLVDRPLDLSFADLAQRRPTALTRDFQCVTGWRVPDVLWRGVKLRDLLDEVGVRPTATHVTFRSFDGAYTESLSLEQARRNDVLVAYEMEGHPISKAHGGPVRLYVAPMYGYKSIKWLDRIEVVEHEEPGYWEVRGYDVDAWIGKSNGRDDEPV